MRQAPTWGNNRGNLVCHSQPVTPDFLRHFLLILVSLIPEDLENSVLKTQKMKVTAG